MECRTLTLTLISASNLKDVRAFSRMKVYARVSIEGTKHSELCTEVDKVNETNPVWNCRFRFTIDETKIQQGAILVIKLYCKRSLGDRFLGELRFLIKKLLAYAESLASTPLSYDVGGGTLNLSFGLGDKMVVHNLEKAEQSWVDVKVSVGENVIAGVVGNIAAAAWFLATS